MSAVAVAVLVLAALGGPAASLAAEPADAAARVVLDQLDAFKRGDFEGAYTYASRAIRDQFDRREFEAMVRASYPEIARPASASVDHSERGADGTVFLFVRVWGANGHRVDAVYEVVAEAGGWRINGVVTRRRDDMI